MNTNPYPQRVGEPDCRDYLRTGRCKYGDSCKYHHPPNVQSGGGIRTPIDPNEPPFPIRPNEPPCQYFLKHGTCKFGQTCKFHHPPSALASNNSQSTTVPTAFVMNVGGINLLAKPTGQIAGQHIMLNAHGIESDFQSQGPILQILPQRPNEQNCLYFLKNGRCRYGATCKYHHPITSATFRQVETSPSLRQQQQQQQQQHIQIPSQSTSARGRSVSTGSISDVGGFATVQFTPPRSGNRVDYGHQQSGQRVGTSSGATHILLADGPIAVMAVNQDSNPSSHYQSGGFASDTSGQFFLDGNAINGTTQTLQAERSSPILSSSAMASTSVASAQAPQQGPQTESPRGLWNRFNAPQQQTSYSTRRFRPRSGKSLQDANTANNHRLTSQQRHLQMSLSRSSGSLDQDTASARLMANVDSNRTHLSRQEELSFRSETVGSIHETSTMFQSAHSESQFVRDEVMANWKATTSPIPATSEGAEAEVSWQEGRIQEKDPSGDAMFLPPSQVSGSVEPRASQRRHHAHFSRGSQPKGPTSSVDDDGLSMMTSALLNMLDTPDSANQRAQQHDANSDESDKVECAMAQSNMHFAGEVKSPSVVLESTSSSAPTTPHLVGVSGLEDISETPLPALASPSNDHKYTEVTSHGAALRPTVQSDFVPSFGFQTQQSDQFLCLPTNEVLVGNSGVVDIVGSEGPNAVATGWSPTWHTSNNAGQQLERNVQGVSMLQSGPTSSQPTASPQNLGFFLS